MDNGHHMITISVVSLTVGLFPAIWEKAPGQNWEKIIDLTSKLGEINDIEHNISSKSSYFRVYNVKHTTLTQVFKYHSDMGNCFS